MKEVFINKSDTERVRIDVNEYDGRQYIDVRQFYLDNAGEWKPTRKGITLGLKKLTELKAAIAQLAIPQ